MSDSLQRTVDELRAELARVEARVRALERKEVRFGGALVGRTSLGPGASTDTADALPAVPPPPPTPRPPVTAPPMATEALAPGPPKGTHPPLDSPAPPPPPPFRSTDIPQPPPQIPHAASLGQVAPTGRAAAPSEDLESTMGLTWVNRIGAVTLILAAGFVFKYAADNGWIGPWMRVLVGMLAGAAACAGAEWLVRRGHRVVAQGVAGLGIAILYFSLFAAFQLFELLPQLAAFGLMAGVTGLGGVLAARYQSQALAILAAIGGFLTPVMLSTGENRPWELNLYLLVLAGGAIYFAVRQRWQGLAWVAYLGTKVLYWFSVIDDAGAAPYYPSLVFGVLYYALFLLTPWRGIAAMAQVSFGFAMLTGGAWADISIWTWQLVLPLAVGVAVSTARKRAVEAVAAMITAHLSTAFGLVMMLETHSEVIIPKDYLGMGVLVLLWVLFAAWLLAVWLPSAQGLVETAASFFALNSLAFAGEALTLMHAAEWQTQGPFCFVLAALHFGLSIPAMGALVGEEQFSMMRRFCQGLGVFFLALAIPLQTDGPVIAAIWSGMGLALAWASSRRSSPWMEVFAYLLFGAAFVRIAGIDLQLLDADPTPFAKGVFFTALLLGACMLGSSWLWRATAHVALAAVGGHAMVLLALLVEAVRAGERSTTGDTLIIQTALISVIVSVYAAAMVGVGVLARSRAYRIGGLVLLMVVVAKLYLFDVWLLNTVFRILAFGVLGTMLLATSFLYSKLKRTVRGLIAEEVNPASASPGMPLSQMPGSPPAPSSPPPPPGAA